MKRIKGTAALLLALLMTLSLCACGGSAPAATAAPAAAEAAAPAEAENPLAPYAGEYKEYSVIMDGSHLILDGYEDFSVTLAADGTGYLDWGADNQGPISAWSIESDKVTVKAGVSEMDGSMKDGVLILNLGDGLSVCFIGNGADTSSMPRITLEEYKAQQATPAEAGIPQETTAEEPAAEMPLEGEYTLIAASSQGITKTAAELEANYKICLDTDGTGVMDMGDAVYEIASWTREESRLTITLTDGSAFGATVGKGFLTLDLYGNAGMLFYYAHEGMDSSVIEEFVTDAAAPPSSLLYACWSGIDPQGAVHLSYEVDAGYLDAHEIYDIHATDGMFYSSATTQISGLETTTITVFRDGTAYVLWPEKMTGTVATTTSSSIITGNVLRLDTLYQDMDTNAKRKDFTVETREIDGVSYTAEVFPAGAYTAEAVYCFDESGQLVYYIKGAPVAETGLELGESVYRLKGVDSMVDMSLFDISAYTIS